MYQITFGNLKNICKYCKPGFSETYGRSIDTCRRDDNSTKDGSWGDCNEKSCPLISDKEGE